MRNVKLAMVLAAALAFGAALGSAMTASAAGDKGCWQVNGSGNCDICGRKCMTGQQCCTIVT